MATLADAKPCSLLVYPGELGAEGAPSQDAIRRQLESKDEAVKVAALKQTVSLLVAGEQLPKLLMPIIKFCLHTENHTLKKLMLLYWEVVDKTNPADGSLLPEMILVCNALKNNLVHANEYIRGSTLRFLCHLKEHEILESLIPSITANLEHRHSYVRKNAALAVYSVASSCPDLVPDAAEMVEKFIYAEANASARRNAFVMLCRCDQERAVRYLGTVLDTISTTGEAFQLAALGLIRQASRTHPHLRAGYMRCVYNLTNSASSNAVAYEAANTLVALSSLPTAVRAAVAAYARLLTAESDNNVKLVILDRLVALRRRHEKVLQEMVMDVLRVLATPNIDIRRKVLALALDLLTQRNAEEVVHLLKKELGKADRPGRRQQQGKGGGKGDEYRKLLVETMHKCAVRFPDLVGGVVATLVNYVGDEDSQAALDVLYFLRETAAQYESRRGEILERLAESFDEIRDSQVYGVALWVLGEYATDEATVAAALGAIHRSVGEMPLLPPLAAAAAAAEAGEPDALAAPDKKDGAASGRPVVLADGTYAQQSSSAEAPEAGADGGAGGAGGADEGGENTLRSLLVKKGDYFVATSVANAVTKLLLRRRAARGGVDTPESNADVARGLLLMAGILRLGTDRRSPNPIDRDSQLRLNVCMNALLHPDSASDVFLRQSREAFVRMLEVQRDHALGEGAGGEGGKKRAAAEVVKQADDLISIRQLRPGGAEEDADGAADALADEADVAGAVAAPRAADLADGKLTRVFQLTGYGDAVYAEARVVVLEYDVLVELLLVNQTDQTLQNVQVELSTSRDLKLVDRPPAHNIAPYDYLTVNCAIKVSSTESGCIFGNIVYGSSSGVDSSVIALNSIHMDIADYIKPVKCTDRAFRASWAELEWENKLSVSTDLEDLNEYLQHILKITNMALLTRDAALSGSCGFLAANLHAQSIFGEPALLNMSVQQQPSGKIVGVLRIRCRSQGIALSLGDKITHCQSKKALST